MRGILAAALALAALCAQAGAALAGPEVPQTCLGFVSARDSALRALDAERSHGQARLEMLGVLARNRAKELNNDGFTGEVELIVSANKNAIDDIRAKAATDIEAAAGDALDSCTNDVHGTMDSISALVELSRLTYDLDAIRANALADIAEVVLVAAGDLKGLAERAEAASAEVERGTADAPGGPATAARLPATPTQGQSEEKAGRMSDPNVMEDSEDAERISYEAH